MIELRFVGGVDFTSLAISAGEYGYWAVHVDAVMPNGNYLGAHLQGGVQSRPMTYDLGERTREVFVRLPTSDDVQDKKFYDFLTSQIGKPYDLDAIAALVAERDWRAPDSWFCSELVTAGLETCGWFETPIAAPNGKITPRDLYLIVSGRVPVPS